MTVSEPTSRNHRCPIEIVARAVWLYFRFNLSLRDVEEMLFDRGIAVSYETTPRWCRKLGPDYARRIRHKAPTKGDVWHLAEVVARINGQKSWLWRAVDQDRYVKRPPFKQRDNAATGI
ncbi:putative transposase [Rhizobium tropici]|uniref:Transposase n=1 Tax=Rhizobium tropici TaxID=398 RepID=A0ABR6R2B4_RHITR|nr:putative transposase [Rhizobium tropici]MBB6493313.1 putative transposase [Rhizobium tropici]